MVIGSRVLKQWTIESYRLRLTEFIGSIKVMEQNDNDRQHPSYRTYLIPVKFSYARLEEKPEVSL